MIYIIVKAGLCNQLFMIFAGISYAIDNNMNYCIMKSTNIAKDYFNSFLLKLKNKLCDYKDNICDYKYNEIDFSYNEIPKKENIIIEGFYQSYKYFKNNYEYIKELLDINKKQEDIKNVYGYLFKNKSIAIHFRIGDYYGLQYYHPILRITYYINSLRYLESKLNIKDYNIYLFYQPTDKIIIDMYIIELKRLGYDNIYCIDDNIKDYDQLLIMSLCDNFIIANSTYSWFGAYLSTNKNKIVCYPSLWFGEGKNIKNTNDLFPPEWIKINV